MVDPFSFSKSGLLPLVVDGFFLFLLPTQHSSGSTLFLVFLKLLHGNFALLHNQLYYCIYNSGFFDEPPPFGTFSHYLDVSHCSGIHTHYFAFSTMISQHLLICVFLWLNTCRKAWNETSNFRVSRSISFCHFAVQCASIILVYIPSYWSAFSRMLVLYKFLSICSVIIHSTEYIALENTLPVSQEEHFSIIKNGCPKLCARTIFPDINKMSRANSSGTQVGNLFLNISLAF